MKRVIFITLLLIFCSGLFAKKPELFKPKYAKLILSKDKKKILTIAFDVSSEDNKDYKILYVSKKFNGSFENVKKYPGNVKYKYHIFNTARFTAIKLPPLYDKNAEDETKIRVEHWANQSRIWRKAMARQKHKTSDPTPQGDFYATVKYKIRQGPTRWDYTIRRSINTSDTLKSAPLNDFTDKANINLNLVDSVRSKSKKGVIVSVNYAGSSSASQNTTAFVDNHVSWLRGMIKPEADIIIKKKDGERVDKFTKYISQLAYRNLSGISRKKIKKTERAKFMTRVPDKGGSVEVIVDGGPMFGIMKTSAEY